MRAHQPGCPRSFNPDSEAPLPTLSLVHALAQWAVEWKLRGIGSAAGVLFAGHALPPRPEQGES